MSNDETGNSQLDNLEKTGMIRLDVTRRRFLGWSAASVVAVSLAGCQQLQQRGVEEGRATSSTGPREVNGEGKSPEEIDESHKKRVEAFPAATEGKGNQLLEPTVTDGVKVFDLTCTAVDWEYEPGKRAKAMTYNSMVPGPLIKVTDGDRIRINVKNELDASTTVHWHGQAVPNDMDGVGFVTQDPIEPGGSFAYEFDAGPHGTHMYHSHHNATEQVGRGLFGPLIVEPKDPAVDPEVSDDHLFVLHDVLGGFTINGKSFPATEPIMAKEGERIRLRFMNAGLQVHPIHLHGLRMEFFARDGYTLPANFSADTITVAPGERWDAVVHCDNKGAWAFHCHVLTHVDSKDGMFGMVTLLIVE